jgi:hypothetical protein
MNLRGYKTGRTENTLSRSLKYMPECKYGYVIELGKLPFQSV